MIRVTLVDDNVPEAAAISTALDEAGMSCLVVTSKRQAEALIDANEWHDPDVAIVSATLVGATGFPLCAELRERGIPTLLLTVRGDHAVRLVGARCGANDYVSRPFDPADLVGSIERLTKG